MKHTYFDKVTKLIDEIENDEDCFSEVCYADKSNKIFNLDFSTLSFEGVNENGYEVYRKQNGEKITAKKVISTYNPVTGRCNTIDIYPGPTPIR